MIAAAPPRDPSLGLVRLIFLLKTDPTQSVPKELNKHLENVITEAKALLSNPDYVPHHTSPEAIALALWMKANDEVTAAIDKIKTFESIDPVLVKKILDQMSTHPGY
jgi:hypothetical protein